MGGHTLESSKQEKDLGVLIDDSLKPSAQCVKLTTFNLNFKKLKTNIFSAKLKPEVESGEFHKSSKEVIFENRTNIINQKMPLMYQQSPFMYAEWPATYTNCLACTPNFLHGTPNCIASCLLNF